MTKKVLILEDDEQLSLIFRTITSQIMGEFWTIHCHDNVASATEDYNENKHEILLIDNYVFGNVTGITMLINMANLNQSPELVLFTSSDHYFSKFEGEFFDHYIGKSLEQLSSKLYKYLSKID